MWTNCIPCTKCYKQTSSYFDPLNSSSYRMLPCDSNPCKALPHRPCGAGSYCIYQYAYDDGSKIDGVLGSEDLTFYSSAEYSCYEIAEFENSNKDLVAQAVANTDALPKRAKKPTCMRLNGDNFLWWSQSVRMYIRGQGKTGYITSDKKAPALNDPLHVTWDAENSMVMTWLVNFMEEDISINYMCYPMQKIYGIMLDLDLFSTYEWKYVDDCNHHKKTMEDGRIYKFLTSLNVEFDEVRGRIIGRLPLPSIGEVFSKVKREESRRSLMISLGFGAIFATSLAIHVRQDQNSGMMIGRVRMIEGLYYSDEIPVCNKKAQSLNSLGEMNMVEEGDGIGVVLSSENGVVLFTGVVLLQRALPLSITTLEDPLVDVVCESKECPIEEEVSFFFFSSKLFFESHTECCGESSCKRGCESRRLQQFQCVYPSLEEVKSISMFIFFSDKLRIHHNELSACCGGFPEDVVVKADIFPATSVHHLWQKLHSINGFDIITIDDDACVVSYVEDKAVITRHLAVLASNV
ncbi:hypothetical protein ZIOFF_063935 [Zingiber officinale]|uniref:Xylanase inhibitor N-terminal domain-containing protein n=1 Tax=Zingiber officinale TaxID=94328 RepID=A0A8J5F5T2_ZINOF|nr:hypothetical protein ZIOFF_063935 [Zingiber officinale]